MQTVSLRVEYAQQLWQLEQLVGGCSWSLEQFAQTLVQPGRHLGVLDVNGQLLAYVLCADCAGEWEILQISVHPDHRRQGLARCLLQGLQQAAQNAEGLGLLLEVRAGNLPALALYEGLGFVIEGRRKGYYPLAEGAREDALLLRWTAELSAH